MSIKLRAVLKNYSAQEHGSPVDMAIMRDSSVIRKKYVPVPVRGGGTMSCEMMKTKLILMKCQQCRVGGPAVFCFCEARWKGLKSLKPDTGHQSG